MPDNQEKVVDTMQQIRERKQLYQSVFESSDGEKVLEDLNKRAFGIRSTFHENPQRMAFNEGQRSIILHIKGMMNIDIKKTESLIKQQQGENNV